MKFYLIAIRRISFLDNFLSGGWVGTSFLNSAKAPLTFCCLQRSLLLVNNFFVVPLGCTSEEAYEKQNNHNKFSRKQIKSFNRKIPTSNLKYVHVWCDVNTGHRLVVHRHCPKARIHQINHPRLKANLDRDSASSFSRYLGKKKWCCSRCFRHHQTIPCRRLNYTLALAGKYISSQIFDIRPN